MTALRRASRAARWRASALTRVLPDFLVIGAQKAGTTSLYHHLCSAEEVLAARKKEVRFFDRHWERGTLWYRWNFPTRVARHPPTRARRITGEATPDYLVHPRVPARVAATLPACRLLVVLRHPVDRAHSQHRMNLQLGVEDRPFPDAVDDELRRLARRAPDDDHWDVRRGFHSYVERSRYHPQLRRWLAHVPASRIHVATLEDLRSAPEVELPRIDAFLGLGSRPATAFTHANRGEHDSATPELRRDLAPLFAEDLRRTEELLGRELGYGPSSR